MFAPRILGRTGLTVCPIGLSSGYGVPAAAVERAVEAGVNYLYWGSRRTRAFPEAIRNAGSRRDQLVLVVQSYAPTAGLITRSLERGLVKLGVERVEVLLLGWWNRVPPPAIAEACERLKERGLVRFIGVSSHKRTFLGELAKGSPDAGIADVLHVRYNAAHRGAEQDVFPHLGPLSPGIVAYTATCWKKLLRLPPAAAGERTPAAGDCYRFVLAHPAVSVCMTGPSSAAHVDELLATLQRGPMDDDQLAWMRRVGDAVYGKAR
jgi:aryl-alcohol dehydrogenase-like predicted oxidoreductase